MQVEVTDKPFAGVEADLHAMGLFDGDELPQAYRDLPGARDVKTAFKKLTLLRPERPERLLIVGLGKREDLDAERLRVAAALAVIRGRPLRGPDDRLGAPRAGRRPARHPERAPRPWSRARCSPPTASTASSPAIPRIRRRPGSSACCWPAETMPRRSPRPPRSARVASEAANRARELQGLPSNVVTPSYLADRAREIADAHEPVTAEVLGRAEIEQRGMGGLAAVARGSAEEPR